MAWTAVMIETSCSGDLEPYTTAILSLGIQAIISRYAIKVTSYWRRRRKYQPGLKGLLRLDLEVPVV
jgi:hypothetical protein